MNNKLIVSDDFIEAFRLFNVKDINDIYIKLSKYEKYILILKCLDLHDELNKITKINFSNFETDYVISIYDFLVKYKTNDIINEILEKIGSKQLGDIEIINSNNKKIEVFSQEEIREYKIKSLITKYK